MVPLPFLSLLVALLAAASEPPAIVAPDPGRETEVTLTCGDDYVLHGSLHRPAHLPEDEPLPAVVALHPIAHTREYMENVISALLARRIAVLSLDLRGHGQSTLTPDHRYLAPQVLQPRHFQAMIGDQKIAVDWLQKQPGVRTDRIGMIGSGLSALIAAEAAGADGRIRALVLVGPSVSVFGISGDDGLVALGDRPAWIGTSSLNREWLARAETMAKQGAGERTLRTYEASVPRNVMLLDLPELIDDLASWLAGRLAGPGS
jgi:alpha-beta hydrolase superfamily lysophospholipase